MTFEDQPNKAWDGVYMKWFSFALDDLLENKSVPLIFCRQNRLVAGDVFIVKFASAGVDEHGQTAYENFLRISSRIFAVEATSPLRNPYHPDSWFRMIGLGCLRS
jgi:hypothetical protein